VKLTVSSATKRDFAEAVAYYQAVAPELAVDFIARFDEALARLAVHPLAFRERREGIRVVVVRRFPYALRFRLLAGRRMIRVLSLRHVARKPE
jgi:plasmid stabilization system protein ParE